MTAPASKILRDVRKMIRDDGLEAVVANDGEYICPVCARENYREISWSTRHRGDDGWEAIGVEDLSECIWPDVKCAHCYKELTGKEHPDEK